MKRTLFALALVLALPGLAAAGDDSLYTSDFETAPCSFLAFEDDAFVIDNTDIATPAVTRRNDAILAAGGQLPRVALSKDDPLVQGGFGARRAYCADQRAFGPSAGRTAVACGAAIGVVKTN